NSLAGFHGTFPSGLAVGDFNGDGKPDLLATDFSADDVAVLLNNSPTFVVQTPVTTTTTVSSNANPAVFGQPVLLTAAVTAANGTVPTGTVTFCDGKTVLGQAAVDPTGHASILVEPNLGANSITASFAGTGAYAASTSKAL